MPLSLNRSPLITLRLVALGVLVICLSTTGCNRGRDNVNSAPKSADEMDQRGDDDEEVIPTVSDEEIVSGSSSPAAEKALRGEAALVSAFRRISAPLLELNTKTTVSEQKRVCADVADKLGAAVDPVKLLEADYAIQDAQLRELALGDRTARSDLLLNCLAGDQRATLTSVKQVRTINTLFIRRLQQL